MVVRPRDSISHPKFGRGVVVRPDGDKVVADFVGWGLKRVLVAFIQLEAQAPWEDDPVASNVVSLPKRTP